MNTQYTLPQECTPGPWSVLTFNTSVLSSDVWPVRRISVGNLYDGAVAINPRYKWNEADMRLISAAPDLFEACAEFCRKVDRGEARSTRSYAQMKAALAKALGEDSEKQE